MADKVQSLPQVYVDAVKVIKKAILDTQYRTARMASSCLFILASGDMCLLIPARERGGRMRLRG